MNKVVQVGEFKNIDKEQSCQRQENEEAFKKWKHFVTKSEPS